MVAFPFFVSLRDAWHSPSLTLERLQKPAPIFRNPGRQPATAQGKSASWTVKRTFKAAMSKPTPSPLERARSETNKLWRGRIVGELLHRLIHGTSRVCAFSHIGGLTTYCRARQPEAFLRLEQLQFGQHARWLEPASLAQARVARPGPLAPLAHSSAQPGATRNSCHRCIT